MNSTVITLLTQNLTMNTASKSFKNIWEQVELTAALPSFLRRNFLEHPIIPIDLKETR